MQLLLIESSVLYIHSHSITTITQKIKKKLKKNKNHTRKNQLHKQYQCVM